MWNQDWQTFSSRYPYEWGKNRKRIPHIKYVIFLKETILIRMTSKYKVCRVLWMWVIDKIFSQRANLKHVYYTYACTCIDVCSFVYKV